MSEVNRAYTFDSSDFIRGAEQSIIVVYIVFLIIKLRA